MVVEITYNRDRKIRHEFNDCSEAVRFASYMLTMPEDKIRRGLRSTPLTPSFTASRNGFFVRIGTTPNDLFIPNE